MLREIILDPDKKVNHKRWYSDKHHDLILFLNDNGDITRFEFCYDKIDNEHVVSWSRETHLVHARISDGEQGSGGYKMSPIYRQHTEADNDRIRDLFIDISQGLETQVRLFVIAKLQDR
jgi:hypothetical protein